MKPLASALFALAAFVPGRTEAACDGSCSPPACTLNGIPNTPLGVASLSIDDGCHLLVSNIGSNGFDGVVQSVPNCVYMVTQLVTPNFSGSILGTRADITQIGAAGGVAGRTISVTTIANVSGALMRVDMDCSTIAVTAYSTEIYNAGGLVYSQPPTVEPPILLFPKSDVVAMACALLPNGDLYTTLKLLSEVPIQIQTSQGTLGPYTGGCIKMSGYNPALVPTLQEAIENRFRNTGTIEIESLYAGDLPDIDTVCPLAMVPIRAHTWGRLKALYH